MKRNRSDGGRGLFYAAGLVAAALVVVLVACSGGERPPSEIFNPLPNIDSGGSTSSTSSGSSSGNVPSGLLGGVEKVSDTEYNLDIGDNGFVNCGTQGPPKSITVNNSTDKVINYTLKLTAGESFYTISPAQGGAAPIGGQGIIQVTPKTIPAASEITPDLYAGTLEISIVGQTPISVRMHQTARGAIIAATPAGAQLNFGDVKIGTPGTQNYALINSGNLQVNANLSVGTADFRVNGTQSSGITLAPGANGSATINLNTTQPVTYNDTLSVTYDPPVHCKTPPANPALTGKGTTSVGVSPGIVQFGNVDCGTAGDFQVVTITSSIAMNFTPTLAKLANSPFTLANSTGGAVNSGVPISMPAASTYQLRIVPKTIPIPSPITPNGLTDTLTVGTDVAGDLPHTVTINMTAQGAIFGFNPVQIVHTNTINHTQADNIALVNTGNKTAPYSIVVTNRDGFPTPPAGLFVSSLSTGTAAVGNTNGTLTSTTPGTFNTTVEGALQVTSPGGVLCSDLPPKMPLTVTTAAGTSITLDPPLGTAIDFGRVDCGTTFSQNGGYLTLTLTTIQNTTFSPNLNNGPASYYTLATNTGTPITLGSNIPLTAGSPYVLRIVPKQIPPRPLGGVNDPAFNDTLTIASGVDATKNVSLLMGGNGAIFTFNPPSITTVFTGAPFNINYTLINSGSISGQYTITSPEGGYANSNLTSGTALIGNTVGVLNIVGTGNKPMILTSTSVLCGDPPTMPVTVN